MPLVLGFSVVFRDDSGMSERLPSPEPSPELVSEAILQFLRLHMERGADVLPDYSYKMRAGLSDAQLQEVAPVFKEYDVLLPRAVRFGRITASPQHDMEAVDTVDSRGYTYIAFEYPERVVAFGGLLSSKDRAHWGEAAKIWRHETLRSAVEPPYHGVKEYAYVAGRFIGQTLHKAGVIRPAHTRPTPAEMSLLLHICSV